MLRVLALTPLNTPSLLEVKLRFGEIFVSPEFISPRGSTAAKKVDSDALL